MYSQAFALVLRYRVLEPVRAATGHRMRVTAVVPEAEGVVSILIEGHALDELRAEPGQFFRWRFLAPDLWFAAHPFSLSAPPAADRPRLTVKALGDGTRRLQEVEAGTWVIAEGPYGAMTAQRRSRDVALIAGGVGITPMRALFETPPLLPEQDLVLLYRARTRDEVVFRDELVALADERRARDLSAGQRPRPAEQALPHPAGSRPGRPRRVPVWTTRHGRRRAGLDGAGLAAHQLHEERFAF